MPATVTIVVDGRDLEVEAGLTPGSRILELAGGGDDLAGGGDANLFLLRDEDADTPVLASDCVLVHGGERFTTAGAALDTNPDLQTQLTPEFNGAREMRLPKGRVAVEEIKQGDAEVTEGRLFAVASEEIDVELPDGAIMVVQTTDSYFLIPQPEDALDEVFVDIEECARYKRRPPRWHRYRIRVDRTKFVVDSRFVTGADVLGLVGKSRGEWALNQKLHGGRRIRIEPDYEVDLAKPGTERFETVRKQAQQGMNTVTIRKLAVRNFKKFEEASFELANHVVIVGPNNCGKTTLLQAMAVWSEVVDRWLHSESTARNPQGEYLDVEIGPIEFVPYADYAQLWRSQDTSKPMVISVKTERWKVAFELSYIDKQKLSARPVQDVQERHLDACGAYPVSLVYIPPFSGLNIQEAKVAPETVVSRLMQDMVLGRGGSVLRNMLFEISRNDESWHELQNMAGKLFGYELSRPSGAAEIRVGYRHSHGESLLDIACGARGFLHILFVYASLYYKPGTTILADEPDANLHLASQDMIYHRLRDLAHHEGKQLIVVTHSERLMDLAKSDIRLLTSDTLRSVGGRDVPRRETAKDALKLVKAREFVQAQEGHGILYVEGQTDLDILREFAKVLEHGALEFLEKPFWRAIADEPARDRFPARHFEALRLDAPEVRGILLVDRNGKNLQRQKQQRGIHGLQVQIWERYEVESYLIHPEAIRRFVEMRIAENAEMRGTEEGVVRVDDYMKKYYGFLYHDAFDNPHVLTNTKGKVILSDILGQADIYCEDSEYHHIANLMRPEEVHPDVIGVLDAVEQRL